MTYKVTRTGCIILFHGRIVAETPTEDEAIEYIKEHLT